MCNSSLTYVILVLPSRGKDKMKNIVEQTLSFLPNVRVSVATQMDPERSACAPKYNVHTKSEIDADCIQRVCETENWKVTRSGPFLIHVDPTPDYKNTFFDSKYASVWDD